MKIETLTISKGKMVTRGLMVLCCVLLAAGISQATLVDDFDGTTLDSEWNVRHLLTRNGTVPTFDTSSNPGSLTITSTSTTAEQMGLLRDDHTLEIGETLIVDMTGITANGSGWCEAGLMISASADVGGDPGTLGYNADLREDLLLMTYERVSQKMVSTLFDGTTFSQEKVYAAVNTLSQLWIKRTGQNVFEAGFTNIYGADYTVRTVTFTSGNMPAGAAVGIYGDMRNVGDTATFDNLQIIPEPATMLLLGLGGLVTFVRRR